MNEQPSQPANRNPLSSRGTVGAIVVVLIFARAKLPLGIASRVTFATAGCALAVSIVACFAIAAIMGLSHTLRMLARRRWQTVLPFSHL
jgi:hypothetical protein